MQSLYKVPKQIVLISLGASTLDIGMGCQVTGQYNPCGKSLSAPAGGWGRRFGSELSPKIY